MPNIQSAKKRVKVTEKKTLRNRMVKSSVRTSIKKLEAAIAAMAQSDVDAHTSYMSLEDAQSFSTSLEGTFIGVGLQFYQNSEGAYIVADIFENSPAQEAGIQRGDRLVSVNGTACADLSSDEIKSLLTKEEGKAVTLVVERDGQDL